MVWRAEHEVAEFGGFLVGENNAFFGGGVFDEGPAGLVGKRALEEAEDERIDEVGGIFPQRPGRDFLIVRTLPSQAGAFGGGCHSRSLDLFPFHGRAAIFSAFGEETGEIVAGEQGVGVDPRLSPVPAGDVGRHEENLAELLLGGDGEADRRIGDFELFEQLNEELDRGFDLRADRRVGVEFPRQEDLAEQRRDLIVRLPQACGSGREECPRSS